ncbi:MAG: TolC family protein [Paramuribaculum sp.]|nr:TolC family protein [Paramuribaculum sp.]
MSRIKFCFFLTAALFTVISAEAQITLDYCLDRARENYPLIKKFDLVNRSEKILLSDINKGWLPRIGLFAQGTAQNSVSAFPDALKAMLDKTGTSVAGMSKLQYKAGIELNQTIWDGGYSKYQRAIERATGAQAKAVLEVEIYPIRDRVENIYFSILLLEEQMDKMQSTVSLLESNHSRIGSMVAAGIATHSDADMIEAQILTMLQQLTEAKSAYRSYRQVLELFINEDLGDKSLVRPVIQMPGDSTSARPELALFDRQIELNNERSKAINASQIPRIGFFAQVYYGNPGLNMFQSMMKRDLSFNAMAGVKVTWNIDAFYSGNTSRKRLVTASDMINSDRDRFLFDNALKSTREYGKIEGLRKIIEEDNRIVELRGNVRRAAESQLNHGIIDTTALLAKITDENNAILNHAFHEIQLLQTICQLKNTLNR